jgi:TPR repeat protein
MKYFKMASDRKVVSAMFNYALGLEHGYLGTPDIAGATKYYRTAADAGHEEAKAAWTRLTQSKLPSLHAVPSAVKA